VRNRNQNIKKGLPIGNIIAMIFVIGIIALANFYGKEISNLFQPKIDTPSSETIIQTESGPVTIVTEEVDKAYPYLPEIKGELVHHKFYSLSYMEQYEQPEWVCYKLTKEMLRRPNVPRSDWFNVDPMITTGSAKHFDYKGSGYTRGHIAPAGDMSFDQTAMEESFFMSNMMPQLRAVNNGIWRELEEQTRDWTFQNNEVYIVSGPYFGKNPKFFKKHKIAIPDAFYKIIFDVSKPTLKGIAFLIPHEKSEKPLQGYAMTIDSLESITGINFFKNLYLDKIEKIESNLDISAWPISEARYRLRVEQWNNQ
jgi:endonuclease G